jgi:hypothetical protein
MPWQCFRCFGNLKIRTDPVPMLASGVILGYLSIIWYRTDREGELAEALAMLYAKQQNDPEAKRLLEEWEAATKL